MSPRATVVVCAYTQRRWAELTAAIGEAAEQARDAQADVVVIIDHNDVLLERVRAAFAGTGVRVEPNTGPRGLSGARNTGWRLARGEVVIFLDDDARPRPGWLAALLAPYADPTIIAVGGSAAPVWPAGRTRPPNLPAGPARGELDWVVGCSFTGQAAGAGPVRNLMGCNMSFRRDALAGSGGFAENLGRVGTLPLGCEETELCIRVRRSRPGAVILFDPAAAVDHHVSADRLSWRYLASRCRSEGLSKAAVAGLVGADDALETERGYVRRVLPRAVARELGGANLPGAAAIVVAVAAAGFGYLQGRLAGLRTRRAGRVPVTA
ncbi:glycosyltransferase family 2 protein [Naumannella huperziae]